MRCVIRYKYCMSVGLAELSFKNVRLPLLALVFVGGLSGCTSATPKVETEKTASCETVDWYELGRRDGSQGTPTNKLSNRQKECAKAASPDWETIYTNGRNAGLVEFCDPKNGYELGRMGVAYYYVCPSTVEPAFLTGYRQGQQARELELQNQKIDEQIDQLVQKLTAAENPNEKQEITQQLEELKKSRAKNDQELTKIITK